MTVRVSFCAYDKPGVVGGTSSWIEWLLPVLQAKGFRIRCYVFLHTGEKGPVTDALESNGVECITTFAHYYTEDRVRWLIERLAEDPCDVFVPNEVASAYFAARWAHRAGIATIGVLHTDGANGRAIQSRFIFGRKSYALDAVVCVSEHIEQHVREEVPRHTRIYRIPCGADVPRERVTAPDETLRIAYVGRLAEDAKRISSVVSAFCNAASAVPGVEAAIYGDGPEKENVANQIATEGAGLPVTFAGTLSSRAMQAALLQTHVIVLLSDYEGLPLALMEAMACGCVPVCLRIPSGIPELVRDEETGLLVDDRAENFVTTIRRLRDNPSLWQKLSDGAREHIEAGYSHDSAVEAWVGLLNEVAAGRARSSVVVPRWLNLPTLAFEGSTRKPLTQPLVSFYRSARMSLGSFKNKILTHNYGSE